MTTYRNTLEGLANTTPISGSNMGGSSGDQPTQILFDGSSLGVADTSKHAHGAVSLKISPTASPGHSYIQYGGLTAPQLASRLYVWMSATPTADMVLIRHYATANNVGILKFISTGKLRIIDSAGATIWDSPSTFPLSQWVRVDFFTDTAANKVRAAWGILDAAASVDSTLTTFAGGGVPASRADLGKVSGVYATDFWTDDFAADDAAVGFITPGAATSTLTATVTCVPTSGNIPFSVTHTINATGGTGTVKNYDWDWGDGSAATPPQTSNVASHTYTTAGTFNIAWHVANT